MPLTLATNQGLGSSSQQPAPASWCTCISISKGPGKGIGQGPKGKGAVAEVRCPMPVVGRAAVVRHSNERCAAFFSFGCAYGNNINIRYGSNNNNNKWPLRNPPSKLVSKSIYCMCISYNSIRKLQALCLLHLLHCQRTRTHTHTHVAAGGAAQLEDGGMLPRAHAHGECFLALSL